VGPDAPRAAYAALGYPVFGARAVRADVAERVAIAAAEPEPDSNALGRLASWLGCTRGAALGVLAELEPGSALRRPKPRGPKKRVAV
jgi:ATP-dependent RNA helicase SUPV3L1/SUV3